MQKLKTIYKKNNSGKILEWYLEIDGSKYRTISGQQDGKKTTSAWKEALPKNVGKKNATTAEEQAKAECLAKYEKKLAQGGYFSTLEDTDTIKFVKPMLAQKYEDRVPTEEMFNKSLVYVQPKLDGVRCICSKDGMFSRQGKPILGAPHIKEALEKVFKKYPDLILDGELYNHDLHDNFNKIISLVRKEKLDEKQRALSEKLIQYHVYDVISDEVYSKRRDSLFTFLNFNNTMIQIVEAYPVPNLEILVSNFKQCLAREYEGMMVRINDVGYEHKRSKSLLKLKQFIDEEFKIVELLEGEGNNAGMVGKVKLLTKEGKEFGANMTGTWEECVEYLKVKDEYVGGEATVRYFELTPDGIPRFAIITQLYKENRDV